MGATSKLAGPSSPEARNDVPVSCEGTTSITIGKGHGSLQRTAWQASTRRSLSVPFFSYKASSFLILSGPIDGNVPAIADSRWIQHHLSQKGLVIL